MQLGLSLLLSVVADEPIYCCKWQNFTNLPTTYTHTHRQIHTHTDTRRHARKHVIECSYASLLSCWSDWSVTCRTPLQAKVQHSPYWQYYTSIAWHGIDVWYTINIRMVNKFCCVKFGQIKTTVSTFFLLGKLPPRPPLTGVLDPYLCSATMLGDCLWKHCLRITYVYVQMVIASSSCTIACLAYEPHVRKGREVRV